VIDAVALAGLFDTLANIPARMAILERVVAENTAKLESIRAAMPPALATISEAAAVFKVSIPTMRRWVKRNAVPTLKIGNTLRVDLSKMHGVDGAEIARLAGEARRPNSLHATR